MPGLVAEHHAADPGRHFRRQLLERNLPDERLADVASELLQPRQVPGADPHAEIGRPRVAVQVAAPAHVDAHAADAGHLDRQVRLEQDARHVAERHAVHLVTAAVHARSVTGVVFFAPFWSPVIGAVGHADRFDMRLEDPVLGRPIEAGYTMEVLPIVA